MKKQNILKKLVTVFLAVVAFSGPIALLVPAPKVAAAGTCYLTTGFLMVAPTTTTCPNAASSSASFRDSAGNSVVPTNSASCYTGVPSGNSFVAYTQGECASLEILRANAIAASCTASGGTPRQSRPGDVGVQPGTRVCECPGGRVATDCTQSGGGGSVGNNPEAPNVEIRTAANVNDCTETDLDGTNCGIIDLLNTVFNFVSGGVALAVIGNIIVAGIQYSAAQGDPSAAAKSKKRISSAILAFIMYLSLFAFIQWLIPGGVF